MSHDQRDAFLALCSASQLHFEEIGGETTALEGYRLSHPQVDWQLYREWTQPPATLAQHWGRDLACTLIAEASNPDKTVAKNLILRVSTSSRLSEGNIDSQLVRAGTIDQTLSELYRKYNSDLTLREKTPLLPRWLEIVYKGLVTSLDPDPVQQTLELASQETQVDELPPFVAGWLWRFSEVKAYRSRADRLRAVARHLILTMPPRAGVGLTLQVILTQGRDQAAAEHFVSEWLQMYPGHAEAYLPLRQLVARHRRDNKVVGVALKWAEGNPTHQQGYELLGALVARHGRDDKVVGAALKWLEDNPTNRQAYKLYAPLVTARPEDEKVVGAALKWVENNPTHQQGYHLLTALVAARPEDEKVVGVALKWAEGNPTHQQGYELLGALVAARRKDNKAVRAALKWLEDNPTNWQAYKLYAPLVAARPQDHQVVGAALKWVENNPTHLQGYQLLMALVAARPEDDKAVEAAFKWLEDNPTNRQAYELLRALVAARREDDKAVEAALKWMENNPTHLQGYELLRVLVAARPKNDSGDVLNGVLRSWLNDHQRARGYSAVLKALKRNPIRWQALKEFDGLNIGVQINYNNL
jgi:tetratricopeptide (TPR) repeat protein